MGFELEFYEKETGEVPFDDFMEALTPKMRAKVLRALDLLERCGNSLREPYTKYLGNEIFELRTSFGGDSARCMYFFYSEGTIVITHGFLKKQRKTPRREIERAIAYRKDWISRR